MSTSKTLLQLRTLAREESDMESTTFISDSEFNSYINQSAFELYDLLVGSYGEEYYATNASFITDGTAEAYALPNGTNFSGALKFYKLIGVSYQVSTNRYITLKRFNFADRNRSFSNMIADSGKTIRLDYIPAMTTLDADGDTLDGINGWDEYIIVDAARKAKSKEESSTIDLANRKMELKSRIEGMAQARDAGSPATVVDSYNYNDYENNLRYRINGDNIMLNKTDIPSQFYYGGQGL